MARNVATPHAVPLPINVASMKSMVADSSIQVRWGGWRAAAGTSVRRVLKEYGATAPADETSARDRMASVIRGQAISHRSR
jgi:hypothetical protein